MQYLFSATKFKSNSIMFPCIEITKRKVAITKEKKKMKKRTKWKGRKNMLRHSLLTRLCFKMSTMTSFKERSDH